MEKSLSATLRITFAYVIFSGFWIMYSDMVVETMFDTPKDISRLQTYKGWAFVIVTALLLFILVLRNYQKVERVFQLDGLTGLLSHHMLQIHLDHRIAMLDENQKLVVFYLDINKFKELNQTIGFDRADQFLLKIGSDIEEYSWQGTIVGRLPPDQFALAHDFSSTDNIYEYIRGYQVLFERTSRSMGIDTSCSIGVAVYPEDGESAKGLMSAAAGALAVAKSTGSIVQYHDKYLTEKADKRRQMVEELKAVIASKSFLLVYQPKYVIDSKELSGVEVLIRWHHPVKGFISPAEFIPLAEANGLSHSITKIVVEKAAKELEASGLLGHVIKHVSINVSAAEFNASNEMNDLLDYIRHKELLSPYVRIEITETATLNDIKKSGELINQLRNEGIGVSIDDFGTGYTSLAMLKDFTIDEIKIDRSFVSGLEKGGRSKTIVAAIIAMADSFQINVVAEGVETEAQLEELRAMGCKEAQGYYLGVPMEIATLQKHLAKSSLSSLVS